MTIPSRYSYLLREPIPPVEVRVALGMYGTYEIDGSHSNPIILAWADEVSKGVHTPYNDWAAKFYDSDKIAWCGLFRAVVALRASQGRPERFPPKNYLSALAWTAWGIPVAKSLDNIQVGDTIIFTNPTHVSIAVGVTKNTVVCLGGNQSNAVNIKEFAFSRVYAIRRPPYLDKPLGARHVVVGSTGLLSSNEV